MKDKIALITGGASGIGKAIANKLIEKGARIIITDINDIALLKTAKELKCDFYYHDISMTHDWENIVNDINNKIGSIDILVNNAGIVGKIQGITVDSKEWQMIFDANVSGAKLGCEYVLPHMIKNNYGVIINIGSIAAYIPTPELIAYGASKAALLHYTKSIALYCANAVNNSKIRCNAIVPGDITTTLQNIAFKQLAIIRNVKYEDIYKEYCLAIPLKRYGTPEDIANAVSFLVSEEAAYITGIELVVDGGLSLAQ